MRNERTQDTIICALLLIVGIGTYWAWGILAATQASVLFVASPVAWFDSLLAYLVARMAVFVFVILFASKLMRFIKSTLLLVLSPTSMAIGLLVVWLAGSAQEASLVISLIEVVLLALGYVGLLVSWGMTIVKIEQENFRWIVLSGSVFVGFLEILATGTLPSGLIVPLAILLPFITAVCVFGARRALPPVLPEQGANTPRPFSLSRFAVSPVLLVSCVILSIPLSFFKYSFPDGASSVNWSLVIAFAIALIAIIWIADIVTARWRKRSPLVIALYFVPLLFAGTLVLPLFDAGGDGVVAGALIYSGAYLLRAFLYTIIGSLSFSNDVRYLKMFSGGSCAILVGHMLGSGLASLSTVSPLFDYAWIAAGVAYVIFMAGINVVSSFRNGRYGTTGDAVDEMTSEEHVVQEIEKKPEKKRSFETLLRQPCELVAQRYELSERELDILVLLAAGRNVSTISETLYLSQNTVKSHMNRLYKKLGVHSREELVMLVEKHLEP